MSSEILRCEKFYDGVHWKILDNQLCKNYRRRLNVFFGLNVNFSKFPAVLPRSLNKSNLNSLRSVNTGSAKPFDLEFGPAKPFDIRSAPSLTESTNVLEHTPESAKVLENSSGSAKPLEHTPESAKPLEHSSGSKTLSGKIDSTSDGLNDRINIDKVNIDVNDRIKESINNKVNNGIYLKDSLLRTDSTVQKESVSKIGSKELEDVVGQKEWYVTSKSDGTRYILMFDYNNREKYEGEIQLLFDRKLQPTFILFHAPQWIYNGTVFDGEVVRTNDGTYRFIPIDIIYCNGYSTVDYPLDDRLTLVEIIAPLIKPMPCTRESPFTIKTKKWSSFKRLSNFIVEEGLEYLLNPKKHISFMNPTNSIVVRDHPCDGLIIQERNKKLPLGSDPNVFKVKLVHTSDILCRIILYDIKNDKGDSLNSDVKGDKDECSTKSNKMDDNGKNNKEIKDKIDGVCELFANSDIGIIKLCTQSIIDTFPELYSRETNITGLIPSLSSNPLIDYKSRLNRVIELYNNKVGEFSRDEKKMWKAIKTRYPEKRLPNHIKVIENDMESEDNPVTMQDLIEISTSM